MNIQGTFSEIQGTFREILRLLLRTCEIQGTFKEIQARSDGLVCAGRAVNLIETGHLHLSATSFLVLDEADKMLQTGFEDQLHTIRSCLPKKCATAAHLPALHSSERSGNLQ